MCASTLCPFSSSTRNMALGNGSTTVPSTRIVSSLGLAIAATYLISGAPNERANSLEPTEQATRWPAPPAIDPFAEDAQALAQTVLTLPLPGQSKDLLHCLARCGAGYPL